MKPSVLIPIVLLASCAPAPAPLGEAPTFNAPAATRDATRTLSSQDLAGQVWIADFIFTTCGDICPRMTRQMRKLQSALPKDVRFVSFSIDPERDTLANLQGYARDVDADPDRWFFVRMSKSEVAKLAAGFRLAKDPPMAAQSNTTGLHSNRFIVVDRRGQIRGYYDGLAPESISTVTDGVKRLLREKFDPAR